MDTIIDFFLDPYRAMPWQFILLEFITFVFGIASVWFAKKANILVYPTGLIATVITVYLLLSAGYLGDMMMNVYYSAMSIYGWWNWARTKDNKKVVPISRATKKDKQIGWVLFALTIGVTYEVYYISGQAMEVVNYIDVVTSGIFFTAMWFMANKKLENWSLWIIANLITIPLYAYRGLGMLSLQYIIFTILAIQGYIAWSKHLNNEKILLNES